MGTVQMGMSESQGDGALPPRAQATSRPTPPLPTAQAKISSLPSASSLFILPLNVGYSAGSWSPTLPPVNALFQSLDQICSPCIVHPPCDMFPGTRSHQEELTCSGQVLSPSWLFPKPWG